MQLDLLDGLIPDQCGLDRHHANPSQLQGRGKEQVTRDTSGLSGSISSESADLQSYLVNRLAQRLDTDGLISCKKTWKQVTTPSGRSLYRLQVSVLPTRETDCGLWPTASARDHKGGYQGGRIRDGKWSTDTLDVAVQLTAWPTPTAATGGPSKNPDNPRGIHGGNPMATAASLIPDQAMATWPTPRASERVQTNLDKIAETGSSWLGQGRGATVSTMVRMIDYSTGQTDLTLWPTVTTQDNAQITGQYSKTNGTTLGGAARQCSAKTEKSGSYQLNPRFSLWLMGYPIEWAYCGERVTR